MVKPRGWSYSLSKSVRVFVWKIVVASAVVAVFVGLHFSTSGEVNSAV